MFTFSVSETFVFKWNSQWYRLTLEKEDVKNQRNVVATKWIEESVLIQTGKWIHRERNHLWSWTDFHQVQQKMPGIHCSGQCHLEKKEGKKKAVMYSLFLSNMENLTPYY